MRVNITYSVGIEDIPKRVATLLNETIVNVSEGIMAGLKLAENSIHQDSNINMALQAIDDTRKQMAIIDSRLAECTNILLGYQKILMEPKGGTHDDNKQG